MCYRYYAIEFTVIIFAQIQEVVGRVTTSPEKALLFWLLE